MKLFILRLCWVAFGATLGYEAVALWSTQSLHLGLGTAAGGLFGGLIISLERSLGRYPLRNLMGGGLGLLIGLWVGRLITGSMERQLSLSLLPQALLFLGIPLLLGSLGWIIGFRKGGEWEVSFFPLRSRKKHDGKRLLLDTSAIIDGRIADVCETGFLRGTLGIPQFVLRELQQIADSSDPLKRARGRRGLDILKKIQDQQAIGVEILDQDFPGNRDVDGKLVESAKQLGAPIITNDFNLNKVAQLHGIKVLNINQLANALKPVVLPGELVRVRVIKEGKEYGQGVGYLDDGTMVVVDNAKRFIGKNIDVAVTSVLQTTAGRMIFTVVKEDAEVQAQPARW
jgi:uncharacterized protein YacL